MRTNILLFIILFLVTMSITALNIFAQDSSTNGSQGSSTEGSSEKVKMYPDSYTDIKTGKVFRLFESVINDTYEVQQKYEKMRFYFSPLFSFLKDDKGKLIYSVQKENDKKYTDYIFKLQMYHNELIQQCADMIKPKFKQNIIFNNLDVQISQLPLSMVLIKVRNFPEAQIEQIGALGSVKLFDPTYDLVIKVPDNKINEFNETITKGKLLLNIDIYYNAKDIHQLAKIWTINDIKGTKAYKNLNTGGKNYYNVDQVQDVIKETCRNIGVYEYQDPGIEMKVNEKSLEIFNDLMNKISDISINDIKFANELDNKLLNSTSGLTAEKFKPIVLMREMAEEIKEVNKYEDAKERIESFYDREKTNIKTAADAGWGPFSVSVGYEKTTEDIKNGFFKNKTEFENFKEKHYKETGPQEHIVELGIKLLDKTTFENKIVSTNSYIMVQPVNMATKMEIDSSTDISNFSHITYNMPGDFDSINQNGSPWKFGYKTKETISTFHPIDNPDNFDLARNAWIKTQDTDLKIIKTSEAKDDVDAGQVAMHPGKKDYATLRWISTFYGKIDIHANFGIGDYGAVDIYIVQNNTNKHFELKNVKEDLWFDKKIEVKNGDTIDFMVGPAEENGGDTTPIEITIQKNLEDTTKVYDSISLKRDFITILNAHETVGGRFFSDSIDWGDLVTGWTFGIKDTLTSENITKFTCTEYQQGLPGRMDTESQYAGLWINTTKKKQHEINVGKLSITPPGNNKFTVARWEATEDSVVDLYVTLGPGDKTPIDMYILHNKKIICQEKNIDGSQEKFFKLLDLKISKNDFINFAVRTNIDNDTRGCFAKEFQVVIVKKKKNNN